MRLIGAVVYGRLFFFVISKAVFYFNGQFMLFGGVRHASGDQNFITACPTVVDDKGATLPGWRNDGPLNFQFFYMS
jgi:hypothetical protein